MLNIVDRHVIARESNVVRVDFRRDPDPPAPYFPGAIGLRLSHSERADGRNRYSGCRFALSDNKERASICAGFTDRHRLTCT